MTIFELQRYSVYQSAAVAKVCRDPDTSEYISECISRFFDYDFGMIGEEDTALNMSDIAAGAGHVLARYEAKHKLAEDVYIESHFSKDMPGTDYNNTVVCYVSER